MSAAPSKPRLAPLCRGDRWAHRDTEVTEAEIHLWQQCNPVVTEALVQLTWGGPQVIYNGGLQQARVRYYDADRRRPGLPASVAALVSSIDPAATVVDLVNLGPEHDRTVTVQAGAFAEHTIQAVRYTACPDRSWLGSLLRLRARRAGRHRAPRPRSRTLADRTPARLHAGTPYPHTRPADPAPVVHHAIRRRFARAPGLIPRTRLKEPIHPNGPQYKPDPALMPRPE